MHANTCTCKHIWKLIDITLKGKADISTIKKAMFFTKGNTCHFKLAAFMQFIR